MPEVSCREWASGPDTARAALDVLNRKKLDESLRGLAAVVDASSRMASRAAWALFFATAALVLATGVLVCATFMAGR